MNVVQAWFTRHAQTFVGSLGHLAQHPLANSLTILVIGIALALPACFEALVENARGASERWTSTIDVSVYLDQGVTVDAARQLAQRIRQRRDVGDVKLIEADAALEEFRKFSGFGPALDALEQNPLPHALVVRPAPDYATPAHVARLAENLRELPDIALVQLDTEWVNRLNAILNVVRRAILLTAALLAVGVTVIVGNTIRLDIENRRQEIEVTKLVGGSDAFVRRPFLYSGVWYGLGGGILAWLVVALVVALLAGPVSRIAGLYGSDFALHGLSLGTGLALLGSGVTLGWLGSFLAATRHLREIEPS
jgi:cell division transport system permease protein